MIPTPLIEIDSNILVKMEASNPGGSHKTRAARYIIESAIERGDIVVGETTVIEKTGGNFGFGLAQTCTEHGIPVELAIGLSFSHIKGSTLGATGVGIIGVDMLKAGKSPKEVIEWHLSNQETLGKKYFYTDQFNNLGCLEAHEFITGPEIACQLFMLGINDITLVKCAGTGASITGVTRALLSHGIKVQVVLVEPSGCDSRRGVFIAHKMEGMSVGITAPFIDWDLINRVEYVTHEEMALSKITFLKKFGYFIGNTSAACFHVTQKLVSEKARNKILMFVCDHGLWYVDDIQVSH